MRGIFLIASLLVSIIAVACNSGSGATPDAKAAAGSGSIPFGSDCTTVSDTSTECASGVCTDSFNMFPTPVCSQKCTLLMGSDPTCPVGSMGQKCNEKGYCRP